MLIDGRRVGATLARRIARLAVVPAVIGALSSCGPTSTSASASATTGEEYIGSWQQTGTSPINGQPYMQYLEIQRSDGMFILNLHSPSYLGMTGTFPATFQNGMLHPTGPQLSDVVYMRSSNTLLVNGTQFVRSSN